MPGVEIGMTTTEIRFFVELFFFKFKKSVNIFFFLVKILFLYDQYDQYLIFYFRNLYRLSHSYLN